ncbi:class I SAM-dependent methyltransferase [Bacillus sp. V3-13]|uniref:class I SAM-dependent methyltransferase n=1 Tax=Bacillus sp. V3-13 TaxID=2053728 RepID=UPI000C763D6C|nr:class I SAM-dependent methyltransferase [Bacillus sp. V3-13]PLR76609.1 class I SAM-dependent methyltransferase [Bacillus sp. V3-13]
MDQEKELLPPVELIHLVGGGDYQTIGQEFRRYFIDLAGLRPTDAVLDIGCGCGRMAVPLTTYLKNGGTYAGFDINQDAIEWCTNNITKKYPNFQFQWIDLYNKMYNPAGKILPGDFKFPFEQEKFDFVFLTSVLTHMLPADMENYISEINRVLKKGAKGLISFFLLNKESLENIKKHLSILPFIDGNEKYQTINKSLEEVAIAYDETFIRTILQKYNLGIIEPVFYGSWSGREKFLSGQDIVIIEKL